MTSTPSRIACWIGRDRVGVEAALREADAVHDHVRARRDAADRAAVDAVEHGRRDAVAGGGRHRVRAVALGVARRADAARVVAELVRRRSRFGQVGGEERVGADQLVVAVERRAEVRGVAAVAELAARPDRPELSAQAVRGAPSPSRTSIGFSGQTPVSITPTVDARAGGGRAAELTARRSSRR